MYDHQYMQIHTYADLKKQIKAMPSGKKGGGRPSLQKLTQRLAELKGQPIQNIHTSRDGRANGSRAMEKTLLTLSITIILAGTHLPVHIFDSLAIFLQEHTVAGMFSYEMGGKEGNGHAQGIIRFDIYVHNCFIPST
jgi:hypothetical protein